MSKQKEIEGGAATRKYSAVVLSKDENVCGVIKRFLGEIMEIKVVRENKKAVVLEACLSSDPEFIFTDLNFFLEKFDNDIVTKGFEGLRWIVTHSELCHIPVIVFSHRIAHEDHFLNPKNDVARKCLRNGAFRAFPLVGLPSTDAIVFVGGRPLEGG